MCIKFEQNRLMYHRLMASESGVPVNDKLRSLYYRLMLVYRYGGIFLDNDVILRQHLKQFRQYPGNFCLLKVCEVEVEMHAVVALTAGNKILMGRTSATFFIRWIESFEGKRNVT